MTTPSSQRAPEAQTAALPRVITRQEIAQDLSDLVVQNLRCQSRMLMSDDVEERKALSELVQISKGRMQIALEALDGKLEPYLWMRGDIQTAAALQTPEAMANDPDRLDFETIRDVVGMARQMAMDSFHRQALSLAEADDPASREVGIALLDDAERQARLADSAYRSLISAEEANRACLISLCRHNSTSLTQVLESEIHAATSRTHLRTVANDIDAYSARAENSQGLKASILRAVGSDRIHAGREQWIRATQGFAENLRGFAERIRRFGDAVAKTPSLVQEVAHSSTMSVGRVAVAAMQVVRGAAAQNKERVWAVLEKAGERILNAEHKIVEKAQAVRDEVVIHGDMAVQAAGHMREAAFHAATRFAGLGGRIVDISAAALQSGRQAVATAYQEQREESKSRLASRRVP